MDWWSELSTDQHFTVVMSGASALIGGGVSLVTSLVVQEWANSRQARIKELERKEIEAAKTVVALYSVVAIVEALGSLDALINESFRMANEEGLSDLEPFMKIRQISGARFDVDRIHPSELSHLANLGDPQLVQQILLAERKAGSILAAAKDFTDLRRSFDEFTYEHMPDDTEINTAVSGSSATFDLQGKAAQISLIMASTLQNLLGQIMEFLERDIPFCKNVAEDILKLATAKFGATFPIKRLEWIN